MTKENGFLNLRVWEKSHKLVLEIYQISKTFPNEERFCLVNQLRRSAISICANIAEGYRKSRKDFLRYLDISLGSLEETKYHLILSQDLGYIKLDVFNKLIDISNEAGKMLNGLQKKVRDFKS